jgi:hypothetical protein
MDSFGKILLTFIIFAIISIVFVVLFYGTSAYVILYFLKMFGVI